MWALGVRTLKWGVCEQSWNDGDLLMLRISESASEFSVFQSTQKSTVLMGSGLGRQ